MSKQSSPLLSDGKNVARGLLMGGADVIPGVSGGTVALVLGIYERLVTAISRFDTTLAAHLRQRRWRSAAEHIDLRFLLALACGIMLGIVALGGVMNQLLVNEHTRPHTLAAFFGAIVASSVLVARMVQARSFNSGLVYAGWGLAGAALAFGITRLPTATVEPTYGYLFLCGLIAICAMILPGISGAYILFILGVYLYLTDILKALPTRSITAEMLAAVSVFAAGCALGLLAFSKFLRWLLARRRSETMAVLCGFMLGALGKIWPFQQDMTPLVEDAKHKQFRNFLPPALDSQTLAVLAVGLAALLIVFLLDWLSRGSVKPPLEQISRSGAGSQATQHTSTQEAAECESGAK